MSPQWISHFLIPRIHRHLPVQAAGHEEILNELVMHPSHCAHASPCLVLLSFLVSSSIKCKHTVLLERQALAPGVLSSSVAIKIQDTQFEIPCSHLMKRRLYALSKQFKHYNFKTTNLKAWHLIYTMTALTIHRRMYSQMF